MDGQTIDRKYTSYMNDAEKGNLKIAYNLLFDSLGAYYKNRSPELTFNQFCEFMPLFAINTVPAGDIGANEIPLVKSGRCTVAISFREETDIQNLQEMLVFAVYPSVSFDLGKTSQENAPFLSGIARIS